MLCNLIKQQDELQKEALQLIEKMDLLNILSKYGRPEIIGSVKLGLMTWRDIDIEVGVDEFGRKKMAEICSKLIQGPQRRTDLTVIDNIYKENPDTPKGVYLGIKYFEYLPLKDQCGSNEKVWKIDIWFLTEENMQGRAKTQEIQEKLTTEKRQAILQIKNELANHPQYRKTIKSSDIYIAVLDKGVKDLEGFKQYLEETGRTL